MRSLLLELSVPKRLLVTLRSRLGGVAEGDDGDWKAPCPFHGENTPSLDYGPSGWHCFGCGAGTDGQGKLEILAAVFGVVEVQGNGANVGSIPYGIERGRIVWYRPTDGGTVAVPLCNFAARVTEEILRDDGAEQRLTFTITGSLEDGRPLPPLAVPAEKFAGMNWITAGWGVVPTIAAGTSSRDRLREAIQRLSPTVSRRTVFTHTGWRHIGGQWYYLHAGGALGGEGIEVELESEALRRYTLPSKVENEVEAVRLSLGLLDIAPLEVTVPLLGAIYRAPTSCLCYPTLVLWMYGETGSLKSSLAGLFLSHFGGPFDNDNLPASWLSTSNSLERLAFLCRDAVLVVDDFSPELHPRQAQELENKVARLIRGVGNRAGRGRLRSDLSARPDFLPNGLIIATGEQLPLSVPSVTARMLPVRCDRDAVDMAALTEAQGKAHLLPHAMAGYIRWLQPRMDALATRLSQRVVELRGKVGTGGHARIPENIAHIYVGIEMATAYFKDIGAVTETQAEELRQQGWEALLRVGQAHGEIMREERPTLRFLNALSCMLTQGVVFLADRTSGVPLSPGPCTPASKFVGWADDQDVYLLPDAVWREVQEYLRASGGLVLSKRALLDMLVREGLTISDPGRHTKVIKVDGCPKRVVHLLPAAARKMLGTDEVE